MASNSSKPPTKVLCKYFMSNCCFKGDLCPFSHNWSDKPDNVCRYYLKGACVQGRNCRYDHVRLNPKQQERTTERSQGNATLSFKVSRPEPVNLPSLSSTARETSTHSVTQSPRKMVTLQENPARNPKKWIQAVEFVPGKSFHGSDAPQTTPTSSTANTARTEQVAASYSDALGTGLEGFLDVISTEEAASLLCPFAEMGRCPFETCEYLHGDVCELCNRQCLNPFDPEQQKAHQKECVEMHEKAMEMAFQVQESEGKQCAICMEQITSKQNLSERRFGILTNCEHCFCLGCIRKWRGSTHTANKTIRACPLCRKVSYYVVPSEVWIDEEGQKEKLLQEYKDNLGKKHCKYFNMGKGTCPFSISCFYRHETPDGTKVTEVPRFYETADGERKAVSSNTLWDYFNSREDETLDTLPQVSTENWDSPDHSANNNTDTTSEQERVWLNYEPETEDLEFV